MAEEAYSAQKEVAKLRAELALAKSAALADSAATTASGARVVVSRLDGIDNKALQVLSLLPDTLCQHVAVKMSNFLLLIRLFFCL